LTRLHVDIETYSEEDLKSGGAYKYAEHLSTEVLCLVMSFDEEDPVLWIPDERIPGSLIHALVQRIGEKFGRFIPVFTGEMPVRQRLHIEGGGELGSHNAQFERTILNGHAGRAIGFPPTKIEQWICTMAKARACGLPGSLGDAASALGTYPKDETGRGIMLQLCRPRSGKEKRYSYAEAADKYIHLYTYCIDDVLAEKDLDKHLPDLVQDELEVWRLDQLINDRGAGVDLEAIDQVKLLIDEYKAELEGLCVKMTGYRPSQREKIANWVRTNGYPQIPDLTADTVRLSILDDKCPDDVKTVLKIYSTFGMKAVSKYDAMLAAVCRDSRIHGMFIYYGAGTGRWSSVIVQLQNLFRPVIKDADTAIASFRQGDLDLIKFLYDKHDPMKIFASCVRGMLIPAPGHVLQAIDFSGVESRVIAWMFGEHWKLDAFRAADLNPELPDNYELAVARGFGLDPHHVSAFMRQIGKVMELSLGYEGGVSAFVEMAPNYKVDLKELADAARSQLPEWALESAEWMWENIECSRGNKTGLDHYIYTTIDAIKQVWREAHPAIVQGWKDINEAAKLALKTGRPHAIPNKKIIFGTRDKWLCMKLPSGRELRYFKPELHTRKTVNRWSGQVKVDEHVTYMGVDQVTRQWKRIGSYGGKFTENAVQAISSDLLRGAMFRLERAGYPVVMHVHDEVVSEIRPNFGSLKAAEKIMCLPEKWALDLPLNSEGFRAVRFRK
jgi:DNA polymerase bacteriophage-type